MSLFGKLFGNVVKAVENQAQEQINKQFSALPPGRMREATIVKGDFCDIPESPGIYRHRNKSDSRIVYVGQTDNLRRRQQQHVSSGKLILDTMYIQYAVIKPEATKDDMLNTEKDHIKRHSPEGNKTKGGNGRR
ncbi:GIY-YIG nuclease family protein [Paenibacillus mesophilus]|uniref:GIY-YIG nuclease family protein n=1 Tax=Paenibacillus mesophilus TaxID=2582849 RepID=UPI00130513DF|nr:GIY-YIG nuclease family protein [Paenibacillus mesophilus]